jgi:hypothetical protein
MPDTQKNEWLYRKYFYKCAECGESRHRDQLRVKRVVFQTMGRKAQTLRSRTVKWLCVACMEGDTDYRREKYQASPGFEDMRNDAE